MQISRYVLQIESKCENSFATIITVQIRLKTLLLLLFWVSLTHLRRSGPCSGRWWVLCPVSRLSGWRSSGHSRSCTSLRRFRTARSCSYRRRLPACSSCPRRFWSTPARSRSGAQPLAARRTAPPPRRRTPSSSRRSPAESRHGSPPPGEERTKPGHMVRSLDPPRHGARAPGVPQGGTEPEPGTETLRKTSWWSDGGQRTLLVRTASRSEHTDLIFRPGAV